MQVTKRKIRTVEYSCSAKVNKRKIRTVEYSCSAKVNKKLFLKGKRIASHAKHWVKFDSGHQKSAWFIKH